MAAAGEYNRLRPMADHPCRLLETLLRPSYSVLTKKRPQTASGWPREFRDTGGRALPDARPPQAREIRGRLQASVQRPAHSRGLPGAGGQPPAAGLSKAWLATKAATAKTR